MAHSAPGARLVDNLVRAGELFGGGAKVFILVAQPRALEVAADVVQRILALAANIRVHPSVLPRVVHALLDFVQQLDALLDLVVGDVVVVLRHLSPSCLAWWGRLITPAPVPHSAGAPPGDSEIKFAFLLLVERSGAWRSEWLAKRASYPQRQL